MSERRLDVPLERLTRFGRDFFGSGECLTYIGSGFMGGKAAGLAFIKDILAARLPRDSHPGLDVGIPRLLVIATDIFDQFIQRNGLRGVSLSGDTDEHIAHAFQRASLPAEIVGDLRALIAGVRSPLAVRSSSMLEDAMYEPFAGVYGTKMIPNNQPDIDTRFTRLVEAIKFVFASTFFASARRYHQAAGRSTDEEKMAVIIQEVVGARHNDRFYPHISGVARSYSFYQVGDALPEEGVVDLALGLGKTIVDGGVAWTYSPAHPRANLPVASPAELLQQTQNAFWAVNMGKPPPHDPIRETEYLLQGTLADAELDDTLRLLSSTYRAADDRLVMGTGFRGPRVLTFAPILALEEIPLNPLLMRLLKMCEESLGGPVEIEFAVTLDERRDNAGRFGFLQVRPMVVSHDEVDVAEGEMHAPDLLLASARVQGNGVVESVRDVIYVKPDSFEARHTRLIARQLESANRYLTDRRLPYLLIGFGRWGSSDPWLGIPVTWSHISGAKVIVEATLPGMDVDLSQGSHFFHNITSFQIPYFCVPWNGEYRIDWDWLGLQECPFETEHVRHVRLRRPLAVKVDGRSRRGVISK